MSMSEDEHKSAPSFRTRRGVPNDDKAAIGFLRRRHVRCRDCGYDLHGLEVTSCPECGFGFDLTWLVEHADEPRPWRDCLYVTRNRMILLAVNTGVLIAVAGGSGSRSNLFGMLALLPTLASLVLTSDLPDGELAETLRLTPAGHARAALIAAALGVLMTVCMFVR